MLSFYINGRRFQFSVPVPTNTTHKNNNFNNNNNSMENDYNTSLIFLTFEL